MSWLHFFNIHHQELSRIIGPRTDRFQVSDASQAFQLDDEVQDLVVHQSVFAQDLRPEELLQIDSLPLDFAELVQKVAEDLIARVPIVDVLQQARVSGAPILIRDEERFGAKSEENFSHKALLF